MVASQSSSQSWQIIHKTAGRARLRLEWLKDYPALHSSLQSSLINLDWIHDVQLSPINKALVIYYDDKKISSNQFTAELDRIFSFTTSSNGYFTSDNQKKNNSSQTNPNESDILGQIWEENKQTILTGVGTTCIVLGGIFTPIPLVPGWPFLLLGAYCVKLGTEGENSQDR